MKSSLLLAILGVALVGATPLSAADQAAPSTADYPLTTCVVSGEDLGSMGESFDYIHQQEGQPDRLVRMCCDGCLKKFKKDPAKYLARLDAAKAGAAEKKSAEQPACCAK